MGAAYGAGDMTAGADLAPASVRQQAILGNTISLEEIMAASRTNVSSLDRGFSPNTVD